MYNNSSYISSIDSFFSLDNHELEDSTNDSMAIMLTAYFYTDGPLTANNPIRIEKIHLNRFLDDYQNDDDLIYDRSKNEIIDFANSDVYFNFYLTSTSVTSHDSDGEMYNVSMKQAGSFNSSYYFIPSSNDVSGTLDLTGEGNATLRCIVDLWINGEKYRFFDNDQGDDIYLNLQPTSSYLEYQNNRMSIVLLVIAAFTFSLPASIKAISELYWGKPKG